MVPEARRQVWYCSLNDNPFGGGENQPRLREYNYHFKNRQRLFYFVIIKVNNYERKKEWPSCNSS